MVIKAPVFGLVLPGTWPLRLAVRTPPFHGGNTGSIPVEVTIKKAPIRGPFLMVDFLIAQSA